MTTTKGKYDIRLDSLCKRDVNILRKQSAQVLRRTSLRSSSWNSVLSFSYSCTFNPHHHSLRCQCGAVQHHRSFLSRCLSPGPQEDPLPGNQVTTRCLLCCARLQERSKRLITNFYDSTWCIETYLLMS